MLRSSKSCDAVGCAAKCFVIDREELFSFPHKNGYENNGFTNFVCYRTPRLTTILKAKGFECTCTVFCITQCRNRSVMIIGVTVLEARICIRAILKMRQSIRLLGYYRAVLIEVKKKLVRLSFGDYYFFFDMCRCLVHRYFMRDEKCFIIILYAYVFVRC